MTGYKPGSKIYIILGLIFTLTMAAVIYIVQNRTNSIVTGLILDRVQTANHNFINYFSELEDRVSSRAELISENEGFITAMRSGDHETLKRILFNLTLGIDFASICDSKGIVIARSFSDLSGDDISEHRAVSAALRTGRTSTSIEVIESNGKRLSIYASVPVYDRGSIIGVVNCNFDLTRNVYVDEFKKQTGCEASIFLNDERISTTITDKFGNRITGTETNDFIADTVIRQQKEYLGNLNLYGRVYGVCFAPLKTDDEVIGMLFTGVDIHATLESQRVMNIWIIMAALVGIIVSSAFVIVSRINELKYARLSEKQLNQQMLMANISRSFLSDSDIDTLISATLSMVGEFMDFSQLLLFMLEEDGLTLTCRDEWRNPKLDFKSSIGSKLQLKEPLFSIVKSL